MFTKLFNLKKGKKNKQQAGIIFGIAALFFLTLLFHIWQKIAFLTLECDISNLIKNQEKLENFNQNLLLEKASLESLNKIEKKALGELHMQIPEKNQIITINYK